MAFALRPYQAQLITDTRDALREVKSVLVQLPTGGGKTAIAAYMAGSAAKRRKRVVFGCHRRELIKQTMKTFQKVGIPFGVIAADFTPDPRQPIQIASIPTLAKRLDRYPAPDLYVPDEAHHAGAATWAEVIDSFARRGTKTVGLSATPERLDGTGLGRWFDTMVHGPSTAWLIENGFLSPYRLFAPGTIDVTGIKRMAGDFNKAALEERASTSAITGNAVEHYARFARGRRAMVFCVSIKHSMSVVERFQAAGFRAAHIDGKSENRDELIAAFETGQIQILCSVDLVSEGFDLPALECAILLRPTQSLALYLQQVGRALRTHPGKTEAIILDHAGNSLPREQGGRGHGLPDEDRIWSLEGRAAKKRASEADDEESVPTRQCPMCFRVHAPAPVCPNCGHSYPTTGRTIEELEGELQEIDRSSARVERAREQFKAKSLDELIALGKARGMKSPRGWAKHVFRARKQKTETRYVR
ncbi:DEAD/DEAH box helicase [Rhodomicrobium lacus]|uniref:DEAD/DEAH box helicase n=1 Tax=Rhodomicrobium lacus TaxID=2498452 RepID=UPI000F8CDD30|nr:DEAD/DEAH box helicase family protein [Rhodomicrobium lacus]